MSDFKLEFTLRQHTPLIHFQHDQEGATLRATEVKAKLDDFLIQKLTGQNNVNSLKTLRENLVWKKWLIGGDEAKNPAFDYKIKILDKDLNPKTGQTPLITRDDIGYWRKSNLGLKVEIFSFHRGLLDEINRLIHSFFAVNNFGKRQSKGWGCFFPTTRENEFEVFLRETNKPVYKLDSEIQNQTDEFYRRVIDIWRLLKSGKNFNNDYRKSLAFKYMADKGLRWDKRQIKKDLLRLISDGKLRHNLAGNRPPIDSENTGNECDTDDRDGYADWQDNTSFRGGYRFVRAMLGLPELYEFQAAGGFIHQVTFSNAAVERFKSPVTFKVFGRNLYAIAEPLSNDIFNQNFKSTVKSKARSGPGSVGPFDMPSTLKTPDRNEFDLEEFLDGYFPCVGMNRIN